MQAKAELLPRQMAELGMAAADCFATMDQAALDRKAVFADLNRVGNDIGSVQITKRESFPADIHQ